MSEAKQVTLDVREALARGEEPFPAIMNAVAPLTNPGDTLILIAPFEPAPLYAALSAQGFDHETQNRGDGSYEIRFTHR